MTRPWRLTRRQRVEMEAALARLRRDVVDSRGGQFLAAAHWIMQAATYVGFRTWEHDYGSRRILRARVAIALRAALRADEDARCEEALARAGYGEATGSTPGDAWDTGYDDGAEAAVDALREWPDLDRGWYDRVPLALWERTR